MTGPIMLALKASGSGTLASCISSRQMWRCSGVQSLPPHSTGQCGTASPAALSTRWASTYCSLVDVPVGRDGVADLLRHLGGEEGAHLLPEGLELRGQLQPHRSSFPDGGSPAAGPRRRRRVPDDPTSATRR